MVELRYLSAKAAPLAAPRRAHSTDALFFFYENALTGLPRKCFCHLPEFPTFRLPSHRDRRFIERLLGRTPQELTAFVQALSCAVKPCETHGPSSVSQKAPKELATMTTRHAILSLLVITSNLMSLSYHSFHSLSRTHCLAG